MSRPRASKRRIWLFDVSAQKSMELQLSQAQKMQAVGQLAGGVAHDFNNLLTAIQLQLSPSLLERHPVGDPSYDGLNEIRQTGIRAADLVRKLLAFSRKSTVRRERLDLGELVGGVRRPAAPPAARGRAAGDRLRPRPAGGPGRQEPARDGGDEPGRQRPRRHALRRGRPGAGVSPSAPPA
jgi:signal transduction histidine kinase